MTKYSNFFRIAGAACLVSGTSIGGGMLAQPVAASMIGFIPATLMMLLSWLFMTSTALILAEVCMWKKQDAHIISLASDILGRPGKIAAWVIYLFMAYLSLTAYISGGGDLLAMALPVSSASFPAWACAIGFVLVFGIVMEACNRVIGALNGLLFAGLILSYVALVVLGIPGVHVPNLMNSNWHNSFFILPLLLCSFSFQMIVPSLASHLSYNRKHLQIAIVVGTSLSLVIYTIWNSVVLGSLPAGADASLAAAYAAGKPPILAISQLGQNWFSVCVGLFSFFALVTSFVGIGWGLFDFLADGLKLPKVGSNRGTLWGLVMLPPLALALTYPGAFIRALESTGGFGDTILNGIIPVLMFWIGSHTLNQYSPASLLKNRLSLVSLLGFAIVTLTIEMVKNLR